MVVINTESPQKALPLKKHQNSLTIGCSSMEEMSVQEDLIFIDCIKRNIVLHKNSNFYFESLEMYCYECGQLKQLSSHFQDPESGTEMEWYDLTLDDPRAEMEAADPFFCVNCEAELSEGE